MKHFLFPGWYLDIIQTKQKSEFHNHDVKLRPASHNVRAPCHHVARVQARHVSRRGTCPGEARVQARRVSWPRVSAGQPPHLQPVATLLDTRTSVSSPPGT